MAAAASSPAKLGAQDGGFHPGHNPWVIALTVTLATFMEVLDTSIANVALPHIAGGLSAGIDESTWVLTSYLVSNAVVLPMSAWASGRIGRKNFYMGCVALFTISSFLCGLAPTLPLLILFRILQGAGGGGLAPSEQGILADTFPPARRGQAFAVYGMAVVLAPAIGPTLGGYITDNFSWRWIFYINVPVGIISLLLSSRIVQDPPYLAEEKKKKNPVDYVGLGLIGLGLGSLQVVLDKGQRDDWFQSYFITIFAVLTVVGLIGAIFWEWFHKYPIVDIKLFRNRNFATANLMMFMLGVVLFGSTVLIPQFLQELMGYTAQRAGMTLSPGGIVVLLLMPIVGQLVSKVDARYLIAFGFSVTSLAMYHMTTLYTGIDYRHAVYLRMFQSVGLAFLFVPINTISFVGVAPGKNNQVSGMINLMRNVGGSVGISLVTTLLARREQVHHTNLIGNLSPLNPTFQQRVAGLAGAMMRSGQESVSATQMAYGRIYGSLHVQASNLAYMDTIFIFCIAAACMVPCVFILKKNRPGKGQAAVH